MIGGGQSMPNRCAPKVLIPSLLIIISRKLCVGLRPFGTELNRKRVSGMHRWQCACDFPLYSQLIGALILLSFPCSVLSANCLLLSFLFYPSSRLSLIIIIVTLLLIDFGLSFFLSFFKSLPPNRLYFWCTLPPYLSIHIICRPSSK